MRETIRCGGDTDTNACIVGGLIGAAIGFKKIPSYFVGKIFQFDCEFMTGGTDPGQKNTCRDEFLSVKLYGAKLMKKLIERRCQKGDTLEILNDGSKEK